MATAAHAVTHDELATLRLIASRGGIAGESKHSCAGIAESLGVSTQTASRRLQRLADADLVERETVHDGQWIRVTEEGERVLWEEYEAYRQLFDEPPKIELEGHVTSGMGEGRHYISLPGYMTQFVEVLGYEPFAGTLNLDLVDESVRARGGLSRFEPIGIDGWEDDDRTYGPAVCYPATVATDTGTRYSETHVIAPERTHHDEDQLELIAPVKLRDVLGIDDGDILVVSVKEGI